jgi:putative solute:sodium symporter small subunit
MRDFLTFLVIWTAVSFVFAFIFAPWLKNKLGG